MIPLLKGNIEEIVDWQTGLIKFMKENHYKRVEPKKSAVDDWVVKVEQASAGLLSAKIASWQTGVNQNVAGRNVPRILGYNGGAVKYRELIEAVAAANYKEFSFQ